MPELSVFSVFSERPDPRGRVSVWRNSLVLCRSSEIPVRKQRHGHAPAGQRLRYCVSGADPEALCSRTPQHRHGGTHPGSGLGQLLSDLSYFLLSLFVTKIHTLMQISFPTAGVSKLQPGGLLQPPG